MAGTPKNAYTRVGFRRTREEIIDLLGEAGARQVMLTNAPDGTADGVSFTIRTADGVTGYRLPVRIEAMQKRLDGLRARNATVATTPREYAAAVAWRTVLDWLRAQLELIANGMAEIDEVLLPYRLTDGKGTTVYAALKAGQIALPPAKGV